MTDDEVMDKAISLTKGYDSIGQDINREFVRIGVEALVFNQYKDAEQAFLASGLNTAGVLYFACRCYVPEEKEIAIYRFILKLTALQKNA